MWFIRLTRTYSPANPNAAVGPQGEQQMQQQQQQEVPLQLRWNWDLTLYPTALNVAYWRERAPKYSQWDFQVVLYLLVMLFAMTIRFLQQMGVTRVTLSFGAGWLQCIVWVIALYHPRFYTHHRVRLIMLGRVLMAVSSCQATSGVKDLLYNGLLFRSVTLSLVHKMFLFCNTGQMAVETLRLQAPLWLQVAGTGGKAVLLFFSEFTTEFIAFCNTPQYLTAITGSNSYWGSLVQSGAPVPVPVSHVLSGRSASPALALTTLWVTDVLLITYLCYMSLWSDMRLWLAGKARAATSRTPGATSSTGTVTVNGVTLTQAQLVGLCQSPFALLLNARGVARTAATVLLHLGTVNMICMASFLLSQVLIQQLLPVLLPAGLFDAYYHILPAGCAAVGSGTAVNCTQVL